MDYIKDERFSFVEDDAVEQFFKTFLILQRRPIVAVDTETHYVPNDKKITRFITKENAPNNTPFLLTLSDGKQGWAIEMNTQTHNAVKKFLENPLIEKVFYNASYDLEMLLNENIKVQGKIHDVLLLHHLINEEDLDKDGNRIMSLKELAVKYLAKDADKFEELVDFVRGEIAKNRKCKKSEISYYDVYIEEKDLMVDYASSDTLYTLQLFDKWYDEIQKQKLMNIYNIEMRCIWAVVSAEMRGYKIDMNKLKELEGELTIEVEDITKEIYSLVGKDFNIDSNEQLVEAFMSLGAEYHAITEKGNWKTDKEVLKIYLEHHFAPVRQLAQLVLNYRSTSKLLHTYIENLKFFVQADGKVHPSFWQAGTRTGRMSSSKPNFQNIDPRAKVLFVPQSDDYIVFCFDYSQQEYKLLAHYAKEYSLMRLIEKGYDVHRATASLVLNKPYDEITKEERQDNGKRMNFALVYGLGLAAIAKSFGHNMNEDEYKLANAIFRKLNLKPWALPDKQTLLNNVREQEEKDAIEYYFSDECKEAIVFAKKKKKEYFNQFPAIANFIDTCKKVCQRRGWIKTWTGRRKRYNDPWKEAYKAPNALIQGGCGDILKDKAGAIVELLNDKKSGIVNFIHDEIQVEIHKSELYLVPQIKSMLEDLPFTVPIAVDVEYITTCWAEKKEIEDLSKLETLLVTKR